MSKRIYPLNWTEQDPDPVIGLTPAQRQAGKDMLKGYINNKNNGASYSELVSKAQDYIRNNTSKHIHDTVIMEILDEIHEEWKDSWTFLQDEE